jgi:hypothetical protein
MKKQFAIGDSVIALSSASSPNQPRTKGATYTITKVIYCPTTGDQFVNIDDTPAQGNSGYLLCSSCHKKHKCGTHAYTLPEKFVKNDPTAIELELTLAVENEDYETAVVIRDVMRELTEEPLK